jgi:hypothetical protein
MSENELDRQLGQSIVDAPVASVQDDDGDDQSAQSAYKVGKYHPPIETQFKPGRSGNPKGRPRGRRNTRTILEHVLGESISLRLDGKPRTVSMLEAIVYAQAANATQGDARSAGLLLSLLTKTGAFMDVVGPGHETTAAGQHSRLPSGELFENIDPALLSQDDRVELSRLAEIADRGGGMTALSVTDFSRAREIVNKGRGKDVTPSA